jgi:hypothetical protein
MMSGTWTTGALVDAKILWLTVCGRCWRGAGISAEGEATLGGVLLRPTEWVAMASVKPGAGRARTRAGQVMGASRGESPGMGAS